MSIGSWRSSGSSNVHLRRRQILPKSEKEFLEEFYIRRRENKAREHEFWSHTSNYFNKAERESKKWDRLEMCSVVSEKTHRESQRREIQKAQLLVRRERLKKLLTNEAKSFEEELLSLPRTGVMEGLRDERQFLRALKEQESRENARLKMEQHWKLNNPEFRELTTKKHRSMVVEAWSKQCEDKKLLAEEEKKKQEAEKQLEEVRRRQEEEHILKIEREKENRLYEWKNILLDQTQSLREKKKREEELDFNISLELIKKNELNDLHDQMKKVEEIRQKKELGNYLRRQSRLKLRARAQQIQDELEEDKRFLEKLKLLEVKESQEKEASKQRIMDDIIWMNQVLSDQKVEEMRREKELDNLFSEEASKLWYRQEQIWSKEKSARESLMKDIMSNVQEQIESKIKDFEAKKNEVQMEKITLQREIESMEICITEEESKKRDKQIQYAQDLSDQINSKCPVTSIKHSDSIDENTLNQLSYRLGQFNIQPKPFEIENFRRRKSKW
ncbi:trichoplein keratin filament-binding protein [Lepeophtheirus salmonis]|uniref:trichoplein keratin filament-binding protein n=1 Tax=Lepeophtheirus salmonis TaxID=72036 RepID=UPI001AE9D7DB|nr:trichoplein keratin filament-binding protein-like [Lepeophtheirus salmonis]